MKQRLIIIILLLLLIVQREQEAISEFQKISLSKQG